MSCSSAYSSTRRAIAVLDPSCSVPGLMISSAPSKYASRIHGVSPSTIRIDSYWPHEIPWSTRRSSPSTSCASGLSRNCALAAPTHQPLHARRSRRRGSLLRRALGELEFHVLEGLLAREGELAERAVAGEIELLQVREGGLGRGDVGELPEGGAAEELLQ